MSAIRIAAAVAATALLAGCGLWDNQPKPVPPAASSLLSPEALIGKWGFAAYHLEADRTRTIKEAKAQCKTPYVITAGPTGGVMMNLADTKELSELYLKDSTDGKTFLGPAGDPGGPDDRQVLKVDANSFTTVWVDPDNAHRYGTSVYERCPDK